MPGFTLIAKIAVLEPDDLSKIVKAFVRTEMTRGIKAFLKACLARIPIRTGFLRGAFQGLIRQFNLQSVATLNVLLNEAFLGSKTKKDEKERNRLQKRKAFQNVDLSTKGKGNRTRAIHAEISRLRNAHRKKLGGRFSSVGKKEYYYDGSRKVLKTPTSGIPFVTPADEVITVSGATAKLNLDVAISYYSVNDFHSKGRGTPWNSLDAGTIALINSLENSVNRFPAISEILASFEIALIGNRITKGKKKSNVDALIAERTLKITGFDNDG